MLNHHALVLIDVQQGFLDADYWGKRNNPDFEITTKHLLETYRRLKLPVIHVQHISVEEKSPLRPGQRGVEFISGFEPIAGEETFKKSVNSAFIGTKLENYLKTQNIQTLVMVGFTSDHCVSTSARMASNLGFKVCIINDCTVTFNRTGLHSSYPAELVHDVSLASLRGEFATILKATELERLLQE